MTNTDRLKEECRRYVLLMGAINHADDWQAPPIQKLSLKSWVGMVYDGLAYGNWPWMQASLKEESNG